MTTKAKLQITAVSAGVILAGSLVVTSQNRKKNHQAALFFSELERNIAPASIGIVESNAFDIYYWQKVAATLKKPYYMLKAAAAESYAKDIHDSWGVINDDEDKIYGVFRALKDHVQVSQVAHRYYFKQNVNLIDDLRARLSKDEVGEVLKIVNKLPAYRLSEPAKKITT